MSTEDDNKEWAFRDNAGRIHPAPSKLMAEKRAFMKVLNGERLRPGAVVVSRTVTPWIEEI